MYCKKCGNIIPEDSFFCQYCGESVKVAESKSEKKNDKPRIILWVAVATLVVSLAVVIGTNAGGIASNTETKINDITTEPTQKPEVNVVKQCLDYAEAYYSKGDYYKAFGVLESCSEEEMYDNEYQRFNDIYAKLERETRRNEPVTGKELERTFIYQGGGELHVEAKSGPAEIFVCAADNSRQYSRFYVRENEIGVINLPGGNYKVTYKIGYLWFDDSIGFGEYCYEGQFDELLKFDVSQAGGWITNSVWTLTV